MTYGKVFMHYSFILLKYLSLIPLGFIEGPIVSTFSGYLARLGYLNLLMVIIIFVFVDILSDSFYYFLGRLSAKNKLIQAFFNKKLSGKKLVFVNLWETHFFLMMFFGKIAYGISIPIIMSAGALNISAKKFFTLSIPISVLQTSTFVILGYMLGEVYYLAIDYVKYPIFFISLVLSITFILIFYIKTQTKNILTEKENTAEL